MRLAERETATATELAAELPITRQGIAKHLSALREAGLVAPARGDRLLSEEPPGRPLTRTKDRPLGERMRERAAEVDEAGLAALVESRGVRLNEHRPFVGVERGDVVATTLIAALVCSGVSRA